MSEQTNKPEPDKPGDGWEWGMVEVMGHRSHAGRFREEERFGVKMLRIDSPIDGDPAKGWATHIYAAGALFSVRLSDKASVMAANKPYESPYRLSYRRRPEFEDGGDDLERPDDDPIGDALAINEDPGM